MLEQLGDAACEKEGSKKNRRKGREKITGGDRFAGDKGQGKKRGEKTLETDWQGKVEAMKEGGEEET